MEHCSTDAYSMYLAETHSVVAARFAKGGKLPVQRGHDQLHRLSRYLADESCQSLLVQFGGRIIQQQARLHGRVLRE